MAIIGRYRETKKTIAIMICVATGLFAVSPSSANDPLLPQIDGEITFQQEAPVIPPEQDVDTAAQERVQEAEKQKKNNEQDLIRLNDDAAISIKRQQALSGEQDALDTRRQTLVERLIQAARSIQTLEDDLDLTENRLTSLVQQEKELRQSLTGRKALMSEVLAALQRIGRNPPPALFVSGQEALTSVRSAIMLSAVLPELRDEAKQLVLDLNTLKRVRMEAAEEKETLSSQQQKFVAEQRDLDNLIKENQRLKKQTSDKLESERNKAKLLAAQATNLRELIARLDTEIKTTLDDADRVKIERRKRAEKARQRIAQEQERIKQQIANLKPNDNIVASLNDPAASPETITSASDYPAPEEKIIDYSTLQTSFAASDQINTILRGRATIALPARGVILSHYGDRSDNGTSERGITIATRANATVTAPLGATVVFAGEFRQFQQLLILDLGNDYHMLLSGMDRIDVSLGDTIAAGEPIAVMGGRQNIAFSSVLLNATSVSDGKFNGNQTQPLLYVEVRKSRQPINSATWWKD